MSKPVVFVIGASGNVGAATVRVLSSQYAYKLDITAGVRNPEKVEVLQALTGVTVVEATMGDKDSLSTTLQGVDALFIVTPGVQERASITIATAQAAQEAGVKHIVVVSVLTADLTKTVFGAQFKEIESTISKLGVPVTYLRLPIFMDNYWASRDSIKKESAIYMPMDPTKSFTPVLVDDIGKAAASILADPAKHAGKTYNVVSNRESMDVVTSTFSKQLGRPIKYVRVSYDDAKKALMGLGFPEWQTDGLLELYKLIDNGSPITNQADLSHFYSITESPPTSLEEWVRSVKTAFQ